MATGGSNIYVGRSRLRRKFRRQRQQRHRDSKKNKSSRWRQGNPAQPSNDYKKLPRDDERNRRPDSGIFSSGSDSEEQRPLLDDVTPAPQVADTIPDCEYCFYPHTPQAAVRGRVAGKSGSVSGSDVVDEGKQEDQVFNEITAVPKDDFDKFWADCRKRTGSDASDVSSDEGIQSGEAGSSGEDSDEDMLWQSFMEKITIWRMEEMSQQNESAAAIMFEADGNEEQREEEEHEQEEIENNEVMENEDDQLLLKTGNEDGEEDPYGEDKAVEKLLPETEEDDKGDSCEVATAVLVEIGGDGEYKALEDPAVWMDDDDEDVVWQVNDKVEFSVKYVKGKNLDSRDDVVKFISKQRERYDVDDDVETEKTVEAALLNPWKRLELAGNSIKEAVGKQRKPKKFICCSVM